MSAVCPNLLATGSCMDAPCDFKHDVHVCVPCGVVSRTEHSKHTHLNGKRHRRRVEGASQALRCPICKIMTVGLSVWNQHVDGKRHRSVAQVMGISPFIEPEEGGGEVLGHVYCTVCDTYVHEDAWNRHPQTRLHSTKLRFGAIRSALEEAAKDKHGVTVSSADGVDFGVLDSSRPARTVEITLDVRTTVPQSTVVLVEARLTPKSFGRISHFAITSRTYPVRLVYGRSSQVTVSFSQDHLGIYDDRIELVFEDINLRQKFVISRTVKAIVASPEWKDLQPKAPFFPRKRTSRDREVVVVPGDPPPALGAIRYVVDLPHNPIPQYMSKILSSSGSLAVTIRHFKSSLLPQSLHDTTYGRHFKALLWAEEFRSEQDLQIYDISKTTLNRHNSYYYLEVPGLAEKRPSVLVGDSILVQPLDSDVESGRWFEGCVHVIRKEEVGMKFGRGFLGYTPTRPYRVRFRLNRYPLRRQHQALDTAFAPSRLLFPTADHVLNSGTRLLPGAGLVMHNRLIETNAPQLQAVTSIVNLPAGSPPFVVFGPPGTGKTITVVEAMRQVLDRDPDAKILACAPSNSAADILAERLTILGPDVLFRFYAPSRYKDQVPLALQDFTRTTPDGHFTVPLMATLKRFRVIVTTCVSASMAHGVGLPRGHFTHIFVDEAGQATEPEVMIGIKTMADNSANVVLAGDPKQLGPIIRSAVARELGLEKSYLERMMESSAHDAQQWSGYTYVQLTQNFRSHLKILDFPNQKFYNDTLRPHGDHKVIDSYIGHPILVNPNFPVVFHALSGEDAREASSPSFFNPLQIIQVKKYIEQLRSDRRVRIADKDIGVITPYHAQCLKIRTALRPVADQVKVGSVEEFQGQERRVIIISTVRSSREWVEYDLKHTLGFLANPRRLNVAVTRAQALLIVIGDATVLALDPLWRSFLNYIHNGGGWKGDPPTWDTHEPVREGGGYDAEARDAGLADMNDLMRRMESLTMQGLAEDGSDDEQEDNVDRPWREVE